MTFNLFELLLDHVIAGRSIESWCKAPGRPSSIGVHKWLSIDPERREKLRIAREVGGHALLDQTLEIADGIWDDPASRTVRINARKHLAAIYNARLRDNLKVSVTDDSRVALSLEAALKEITALLALARARAEAQGGEPPVYIPAADDRLGDLLS